MTGDCVAETLSDGEPPQASPRRAAWARPVRLLLVATVVSAAVYGLRHAGLSAWVQPESLRRLVAHYGAWGPLVYSIVKIVTMVLMLPLVPVAIVAGVLYGLIWGSVLTVVTSVIGASLSFVIGRKLGRGAIQSRLRGRWQGIDRGLEENGLAYIIIARLTPVLPFGGVSYVAAVTSISWRDFVLGTAIGVVPSSVIYCYIGAAAGDASMGNLIIALGLLAGLTMVPVIRRQWQQRRRH